MEAKFLMQRQVAFVDTDMAGIVHFSNFFRYMEEAEHAFLHSRGLSVALDDPKGKLGFPKVSATCDYKRPAHYEDLIDIHVEISSSGGKSVTYDCSFRVGDRLLATGQLKVAFCRFPTGKPPYAIPITDAVMEKLFGVDTA